MESEIFTVSGLIDELQELPSDTIVVRPAREDDGPFDVVPATELKSGQADLDDGEGLRQIVLIE